MVCFLLAENNRLEAQTGTVLINELMVDPNPTVGLPNAEYIELYNPANHPVSIAGWQLRNSRNETTILPFGQVMPAHGYLLVCGATNVASLSGYGTVIGGLDNPFLTNNGDSISLMDARGHLVDAVNYDLSWYVNNAKTNGGWSLELADPVHYCQGQAVWRASEASAGGTPGTANSILNKYRAFVPPVVLGHTWGSLTQVTLFLSDTLSFSYGDNANNFLVGSPPAILLASLLAPNQRQVDIIFQTNQDTLIPLVVQFQGAAKTCISDTSEKPIIGRAERGQVLLSEILFQPHTGGKRYLELYNTSDSTLDVSGWRVSRSGLGFDKATVLTDSLVGIGPHGYLCFTADTTNVIRTYFPQTGAHFIQTSSALPAFDAEADEVRLYRADSLLMDDFNYQASYQNPDLANRVGVALERGSFSQLTQRANNWHSAASNVNYGTPGYANSEGEGSSGQTGVWLESDIFSPNGDGYQDVLNIKYRLGQPGFKFTIQVFNITGQLIRLLVQGDLAPAVTGSYAWDGTQGSGQGNPPGIYIIYVEALNPTTGETQYFKLPSVLAGRL